MYGQSNTGNSDDIQCHLPTAYLFKMFSYSCAAVDKIATHTVHRARSSEIAELLVEICEQTDRHTNTLTAILRTPVYTDGMAK